MIIETDKTLFDEQIKDPCVVDFYTTGCPICEKLAPVFEDLSDKYDDLAFYKVNLDDDITLAERYDINHVPTLILFQAGKIANVNTGFLDEDGFSAFVAARKGSGV